MEGFKGHVREFICLFIWGVILFYLGILENLNFIWLAVSKDRKLSSKEMIRTEYR